MNPVKKILKHKGVIAFYLLIVASVLLLNARLENLENNKIDNSDTLIAIEK